MSGADQPALPEYMTCTLAIGRMQRAYTSLDAYGEVFPELRRIARHVELLHVLQQPVGIGLRRFEQCPGRIAIAGERWLRPACRQDQRDDLPDVRLHRVALRGVGPVVKDRWIDRPGRRRP
nr:hypothetical protein [Cupriavidus gilardii]